MDWKESMTILSNAYLPNKYNTKIGVELWITCLEVVEASSPDIIHRYCAAKTLFDAKNCETTDAKARLIISRARGKIMGSPIGDIWAYTRLRGLYVFPRSCRLRVIYSLISSNENINKSKNINCKLYLLPSVIIRTVIESFLGKNWLFYFI